MVHTYMLVQHAVSARPVSLRRADSTTLQSIQLKNERSKPNLHGVMACEDSNLHAVQAGNLGAAMAGSLPSCL